MNTAAAHLEGNVANSKETREFLGQSVGFENELISQTISPIGPGASPSRGQFFPVAQALLDALGNRPGPAASGPEYAVNGGD
jgi:hypothetical protein